ncbi:zinc-binding metallopeptidase family protein [Planctomicrobium sp. SH664]|uniref:zinc-binding metallopeptidase family protein n=1 Tax=Planctomicrobium sp. SH664 TaxID=3448125 RepID=UPI003F5AFD42
MKTFRCSCGNPLFFENTQCVKCGLETGFCPQCRQISSLTAIGDNLYTCGQGGCGATLSKCHNYQVENVCNACVTVGESSVPDALCEFCSLNDMIPDLSVEGNRLKWARLEAAKRRVLYAIRWLGLPVGTPENGVMPLRFDFLADAERPVFTGHDTGRITINIREADDVEREKARVQFAEPQRTLVGHFRHELGHYYWEVLIPGGREDEYRALFGDERSPTYAEALARYYESGPPANFQENFVSAYASMHSWEDFAETFGTYLDIVSILDTANQVSARDFQGTECSKMISDYQRVGILANELNREMGLKDLVPEVFGPKVAEKICYVHRLVSSNAAMQPAVASVG